MYPQPYCQSPAPAPSSNLGATSLAFGLIGMVFGLVPLIGVVGIPLMIIGLVFGIKAMKLADRGVQVDRGMSMGGIITSGMGLSLQGIYLLFIVFNLAT